MDTQRTLHSSPLVKRSAEKSNHWTTSSALWPRKRLLASMKINTLVLHVKSSWIDFNLCGDYACTAAHHMQSVSQHQQLEQIFVLIIIHASFKYMVEKWMVLRSRAAPQQFSELSPHQSNYNWATDNRSFNITLFNMRELWRCQGGILSESWEFVLSSWLDIRNY